MLTTAGKNEIINNGKGALTYHGLFTKGADITGVTGVASTDVLTKASHGLSNGDVVMASSLTGGAGLVLSRVYFVIGVSGNNFQLSLTSGGSAVDFTSTLTDATLNKWTEISGGSPAYARLASAYASAAAGLTDDSTSHAFDVPAGAQVDGFSTHSALTVGTLYELTPVTQETFGGQGTYTLTDAKISLMGTFTTGGNQSEAF